MIAVSTVPRKRCSGNDKSRVNSQPLPNETLNEVNRAMSDINNAREKNDSIEKISTYAFDLRYFFHAIQLFDLQERDHQYA